jgi:uncharacterized protein YbbC (DUF1343 family)
LNRVRFGADRLAANLSLFGPARRVGMVTNDAARLATDAGVTSRAALRGAGVPLVRLFGPEHGLGAAEPDGAPVADSTDPVTGLPVVSLYGDRLAPPPDALADLDAVLFDVPDVGIRFYTYAWTLTHVIDACAGAGIPVWVLDRPNPLGGALTTVEGPVLAAEHASFLGRHTIPIRHGLTLGELALLWRRERCPDADVRVLACTGWRRDRLWHQLGLPFVPTSPAIGSAHAALLYGGLALFEATNVSVGRGTALSFRAVGAPWLDPAAVRQRLADRVLPGIAVHEARFTPGSGPHAGEPCRALRIDLVDPGRVRPVGLGMALLAELAAVHGGELEWAGYPTAASPGGAGHLERLLGSGSVVRRLVDRPGSVTDVVIRDWTRAPGWSERWRPVLLYSPR